MCYLFWHNVTVPLPWKMKQKHIAMKNTAFNLDNLAALISSESSFVQLQDMIGDMGLEITDIVRAA